MEFPDGSYLDLDDGTDSVIDLMTIGDVEVDGMLDGFYYINAPDRPAALTGSGASLGYPHAWWQRRPKPTYQNVPAGNFLNAMDYAWGDGVTDDTGEFSPLYIHSPVLSLSQRHIYHQIHAGWKCSILHSTRLFLLITDFQQTYFSSSFITAPMKV
jgi:hypothetical protein